MKLNINLERGFFRLWLVLFLGWIGIVIANGGANEISQLIRQLSPACAARPDAGQLNGMKYQDGPDHWVWYPDGCYIAQPDGHLGTSWYLVKKLMESLLGIPMALLAVGFALSWIGAGFQSLPPSNLWVARWWSNWRLRRRIALCFGRPTLRPASVPPSGADAELKLMPHFVGPAVLLLAFGLITLRLTMGARIGPPPPFDATAAPIDTTPQPANDDGATTTLPNHVTGDDLDARCEQLWGILNAQIDIIHRETPKPGFTPAYRSATRLGEQTANMIEFAGLPGARPGDLPGRNPDDPSSQPNAGERRETQLTPGKPAPEKTEQIRF